MNKVKSFLRFFGTVPTFTGLESLTFVMGANVIWLLVALIAPHWVIGDAANDQKCLTFIWKVIGDEHLRDVCFNLF